MPPEVYPPDDPRQWLNRARGDLSLASFTPLLEQDNIFLEDLCYHAQQAAEKALKALLLHLQSQVPFTHNLLELLKCLEETGVEIPERVNEAAGLTEYAVASRYPGYQDPVDPEEHREAVDLARRVVQWVESLVVAGRTKP